MQLAQGEVVSLLGPSGSGKTTLLRAVAGLEAPHRGTIRIEDRPVFDAAQQLELPAEKRNLGLVFQSYALWPHRTVSDNVGYGLKLRKVPSAEIRQRVDTALGNLGLGHLGDRLPHQLSGGQQQRVAIARALVYNPPVILMDEPLSNLDAKLREEARAWLRELILKMRLSALVVTHDQNEAMAMSDRILLLNNGVIEQQGTPQELYGQPRTLFVADFMGSNNKVEGQVVERRGDSRPPRRRRLAALGTGARPGRRRWRGDRHDPPRARPPGRRRRRQRLEAAAGHLDVPRRPLGVPVPPRRPAPARLRAARAAARRAMARDRAGKLLDLLTGRALAAARRTSSRMDKHRLDKWLWAARFYKTRALAAEDIAKGRISVNEQVAKAARELHEGDVVELRQAGSSRTLVVKALSRLRGPAPTAQALYEETPESIAARLARAAERKLNPDPALAIEQGRPTKRDRRQLADWDRWSASADPD